MNKRIVVIGGGTGSFTVLSSLRRYTDELTAIVSMADDGGSTGVLRDELGVLPPGDVRQCLVALSDSPKVRDLFNYRFDSGTFDGHSFGNILLTALEKVSGSFAEAVETASEILRIRGRVIPATLDNVRLRMSWDDDNVELHGENVIDADNFTHDPRKARLSLVPEPRANKAALDAIDEADLIIIAPGDLYTSLGPLLVIDGFGEALASTKAEVVYVCNLTTKHGQTDGFTVADHTKEINRFAGREIIDKIIYNTTNPPDEVKEKYQEEKSYIVELGNEADFGIGMLGVDLLGGMAERARDSLPVVRSLIRHDEKKLGKVIMQSLTNV